MCLRVTWNWRKWAKMFQTTRVSNGAFAVLRDLGQFFGWQYIAFWRLTLHFLWRTGLEISFLNPLNYYFMMSRTFYMWCHGIADLLKPIPKPWIMNRLLVYSRNWEVSITELGRTLPRPSGGILWLIQVSEYYLQLGFHWDTMQDNSCVPCSERAPQITLAFSSSPWFTPSGLVGNKSPKSSLVPGRIFHLCPLEVNFLYLSVGFYINSG